jgi:dimethylamine monooxygenase subunit A
MSFDFDAAVAVPFRMQPGLRRIAPGVPQLTPAAPGSRHQREKLAVLCAFPAQALLCAPGFDPTPALMALSAHAAQEHPQAWQHAEGRACALQMGVAWEAGEVQATHTGRFGLGKELLACLQGLPQAWRLAGLLSLAFEEDFSIFDAASGTLPWLAVCLPSHWAPEAKIGLPFTEAHAPVADAEQVLKAAPWLAKLVSAEPRWERFVWTVTDLPHLHAHPARMPAERWPGGEVNLAWFRSERQTFIPMPALRQAIFTIHVDVQPLAQALATREQALRLHDSLASMSPAVLHYRSLTSVRGALLAALRDLAARMPAAA